jgi:hypothetical protein
MANKAGGTRVELGGVGANYTTADEECTGDMNLGDLPGENGPGPAVYDLPPPSAWDNETDAQSYRRQRAG